MDRALDRQMDSFVPSTAAKAVPPSVFCSRLRAHWEKHCRFEGKGRLPERPIGVLLDEMARHGCKADGDHLPVTLEGKLTAGVYTLPGNVSSQFITGLLFARRYWRAKAKFA